MLYLSESLNMGRSLSPEKQQLITTLLKERVPYQDIVERVECSRRTVVNYASNLKRFGAVQLPVYTRIGRKPTFTEEMKDVHMSLFHSAAPFKLLC